MMTLMNFARFPKWTLNPDVYRDMKPVTVKVLGCLADCLNAKDDAGKVSVRTVCERCKLSRRTVQISLSELTAIGLLERDSLTGEYKLLPGTGGAPQCAGAHGDARGGAPRCAGGRTTVRGGAHHGAQCEGRNKDSPRTSYQELYNQEEEAEAPASTGLEYLAKVEAMVARTGFPRPVGRDLDEIRKAADRIQSGLYPEAIGVGDPIVYLEPRLRWYWDEQAVRRKHAEKRLEPPSLRKTLSEDKWRVEPDGLHWKPDPAEQPKQISADRARALDRLTRRTAL